MEKIDRRALVFGLAALPLYAKSPLIVLSETEAGTVETLMDCIVPPDDSPGAKDAGVLYYLKQLAGPLNRFVPIYRKGLPQLDASFSSANGKALATANSQELTSWLTEMEKTDSAETKTLFRLLVEHTMQGYYGAPENGGNRGEASWRMLQVNELLGGHSH